MNSVPADPESEDRQRRLVLVALMVAMFVAQLANTIMANGLPIIVAEVGGTPQQYTWVITAGMLANTVFTPVAGKLADQVDIKKLFIAAIAVFMVGSILCGAAPNAEALIGFRVLQGAAMAFQIILSMTILALVVPPRARGCYNGYLGAVFAAASVSGPPLGGLIVDLLSWRWCFWLPVPLVAVVIVVMWRFLQLPARPARMVRFDLVGIISLGTLVTLGTLWISMVGRQFAPISGVSAAMLIAMVGCLGVLLVAERRVAEPLLPPQLYGQRNMWLACVAGFAVGASLFGLNIFLGEYFVYGRGYTAAQSGLLMLPVTFGTLIASVWVGRLVTRTGVWKRFVVAGFLAIVVALGVGSVIAGQHTNLIIIGTIIFFGGLGMGATNQNLVLAVQNSVPVAELGTATSGVSLFRIMGGVFGIQLIGVIYHRAVEAALAGTIASGALADAQPNPADLPGPIAALVRAAYAEQISWVMLTQALIALAGFIAALAMRPTQLRDTIELVDEPA